ncbi:MAG: hypothetical protein CL874_02375 [Dehalococcoidales bacterium]|jgi:hypothetical protein|nr:hypothetical protein [Dehalococcoidales bacterium]MDP6577367.1 hypothetical protein [Dehalococcoidales bacterium]|tara:strand:- start:158 stop:538 length:381 start_codon:yes stop_codon:yes gene_type:complete
METTWKPIVAGILNMIVGTFNLLGMLIIIVVLVAIGSGILALSSVMNLIPLWLSGIAQGLLVIIAILLAIFSAIPLMGGIYAVQRKNWGLALAGSIVAILSSIPVGITSTVLVALAKNEFESYDRF